MAEGMMLDANTMMVIIIVVVCAIMFIGPIMWFINWFFKRRDRMVESPIDVHEMLYHKYKKSARRNLRAIKNTERPKRLHMLGDNDAPACDYAKMYGFIHSRDCVVVFFYNGNKLWLLSKVNWAWVPLSLTRDAFGRNYCIKARGFKPKANYQIPIWTENIPPKSIYDEEKHLLAIGREELEGIIDDAFCLAVEQEKSEQLYEENVNSFVEAVNAKRPVPQVYQRDDHLMRNSPEAKYAQEDTEQS